MTNQPEDLRAAIITNMDAWFEDEYTLDQAVNNILRLCEAAALAALPEKTPEEKHKQAIFGGHLDLASIYYAHDKAIATAQANINSVFGDKSA